MSTFSSDRIANIIVPDLQKRFRRGYIDYFNRKDKTYRPVEEVQIRSIVPLEQFEELMKLLDDIVLFTYSNKTGEIGVQDVFAAETVAGELTNYTTDKQAVVGGNTSAKSVSIAEATTGQYADQRS